MTPRAAWRWCAAAGVLAFACSWLFGRIPGLSACGPTGGLGPIIAFELARTPADVARLFGLDTCRATLVAAQKTALVLDALGFIPAYTAFLMLGARAASGGDRPLWRAIAAAVAIAGLCDEIEGGFLYAILRNLPGTPALLGGLYWAVHVKFALLALGTLATAALLIASRRVVAGTLGLVAAGGAAEALYGFLHRPGATMMSGFALAWIVLLIAALTGSAAPSLFSPARAPRPPAPAAPIR